jgi:hypothetical protein
VCLVYQIRTFLEKINDTIFNISIIINCDRVVINLNSETKSLIIFSMVVLKLFGVQIITKDSFALKNLYKIEHFFEKAFYFF